MLLEQALEASDRVDGWLWCDEQILLYNMACQVPENEAIVELGTWMGKSTIMLAAGSMAGSGARINTVDVFEIRNDVGYDYSLYVTPDTEEYFSMFMSNMQDAGVESVVTPIRQSTVAAAKIWTGPAVRLIFIDANHEYEAVYSDFMAWLAHCKEGTWFLFHDYGTDYPGVTRFVDRLVLTGVLKNSRVVASMFLGQLAIVEPKWVKRRLAACPVWVPQLLRCVRQYGILRSVLRKLPGLIWRVARRRIGLQK
jgi:hypothetical protein